MPVGGFPGLAESRRRTIRAPVNPLDKSTVVSIYPRDIYEVKPTISPGEFRIKAGTYDTPSLLVVGPSSWWREIDEEQPLLEIPNYSTQVAESIVRDYCNGLLACNMGNTMPGLFYIPGEWNLKELKIKNQHLIDKARDNQNRWYAALVKLADTMWSRSNGNPLVISDDMRLAARMLDLKGKDWMRDFTQIEMARCFACGSSRDAAFPVCPTCRAIDPNHPAAKDIKFAAQ